MRATADRLRRVASTIVKAGGSASEEADLVARHLVDANLAGHDSHGVGMIPTYVRHMHAGLVVPNMRAKLVKDDGPGIPDSILPHVFDAFSATKGVTAGLGLGLAIVKDIVDRHQGQVTIESSSAGTTVTFLFDGVDEAVADGRGAGRKRVLLVTDNVAVHETSCPLLEKSGFEVVAATDADEALLLITREPVDAVVVDVQNAGRDGLTLVEALANWHTHLLPKVTLHTAYAHEGRVRAVADRYGIELLEKPCPWDKFLETVTRLANTTL